MTRALTSSSALALVFLATSANADVTPQDVWASWQAMMTAAGQEMTVGNTADSGSAVEITDMVVTYKDELGGGATVSFDKLTFTDNGDGTVSVAMPESYPIAMTFPDQGEGPGSIKVTVSQPGAKIIAGGSATETSYDITSPTTTVKLDEIVDEAGEKLDTQAELALTDLAAKYSIAKNGEGMVLDSSFTSKSMALKVSGQGSDGSGAGTVDA
ncbi:MAG TPA: hypothetical protein VK146_00170, partial [Tabrizicola sp.]|nr:hypothetical protein [Tabrizicola sp.]